MSFSNVFPLLPDDRQVTPEDDLAAATAGAVAIPDTPQAAPPDTPAPFGRTWQFNFETGKFERAGGSPAETTGFGALQQWCLMAIHSARYAHAVFSDQFGMEDPDGPLGELAEGEVLADWQRHLTEALLVHDRITAVENMDLEWDPAEGTLTINTFDVVTDEDETMSIDDIALQVGGAG